MLKGVRRETAVLVQINSKLPYDLLIGIQWP